MEEERSVGLREGGEEEEQEKHFESQSNIITCQT